MKRSSLGTAPVLPVSHNPEISKKLLLDKGLIPHLTNFSQAVFAPGQVAPGHAHEGMHEVFFVRSGRGVITVDGADHPMRPDDCFLIERGEHHELYNDGTEDLVLLYFGLEAG